MSRDEYEAGAVVAGIHPVFVIPAPAPVHEFVMPAPALAEYPGSLLVHEPG